MKGFFTHKETQSASRPDGKTYSCASCGLYQYANSPRMKPYGNFAKRIMNIGEAPGETEDERGMPWQGKTGNLLKKTYRRLGIDLFEDCINLNSVGCRPMDGRNYNRPPTGIELDCCRSIMVYPAIDKYKPNIIVLLGASALYSIIGHRWKKELGGINKWRGFTIPDRDLNAWICPVFHPSYVERANGQEVETVWIKDLEQVISLIDTPLPEYKEPEIEIISDLSILNKIKSELVTIDYETTGLKPHAEGHRIICCAVADTSDHCYVFMMPQTRQERMPLVNLLADERIKKTGHNVKYEEVWSQIRLRQNVIGWEWDSMLAAHVLDNRQGITSLKFQTYINFGIIDYASEVSPYLEAKNKGGNEINRIHELLEKQGGKEMLLKYCALDAIYERRLALKQMDITDLLPF